MALRACLISFVTVGPATADSCSRIATHLSRPSKHASRMLLEGWAASEPASKRLAASTRLSNDFRAAFVFSSAASMTATMCASMQPYRGSHGSSGDAFALYAQAQAATPSSPTTPAPSIASLLISWNFHAMLGACCAWLSVHKPNDWNTGPNLCWLPGCPSAATREPSCKYVRLEELAGGTKRQGCRVIGSRCGWALIAPETTLAAHAGLPGGPFLRHTQYWATKSQS